MKFLERDDMKKMAIVVGKRVNMIAEDNKEFNQIMNQIIELSLDEEFSFSELENALEFAENIKTPNISKSALMEEYIERIIHATRRMKGVSSEDQEIYAKVIGMELQRFEKYMKKSVNLLDRSLSSQILDEIVPAQEINFKKNFSESLEIVQKIFNEKKNENRPSGEVPQI